MLHDCLHFDAIIPLITRNDSKFLNFPLSGQFDYKIVESLASTLNWNTWKGNQAPIQKFETPNRKIEKFVDLG